MAYRPITQDGAFTNEIAAQINSNFDSLGASGSTIYLNDPIEPNLFVTSIKTFVVLNASSQWVGSIVNPTSAQDGVEVVVTSATPYAHELQGTFYSGPALSNVITFTQLGSSITLRAYAGVWYVISQNNVVLS
jgi:hypothetical protein